MALRSARVAWKWISGISEAANKVPGAVQPAGFGDMHGMLLSNPCVLFAVTLIYTSPRLHKKLKHHCICVGFLSTMLRENRC